MVKRYQITKFGEGFKDTHGSGLTLTMTRLRRALQRTTHAPYHLSLDLPGKDTERLPSTFNRPDAIRRTRALLKNQPIGTRVIVASRANYDEPAWSLRSKEYNPPPPPESELITYGKGWVGNSSYGFGASGPPGPSDCSGFTLHCVEHVYHITLPHGANEQMHDSRITTFLNGNNLQSGDFVFFNYGRLYWNQADHVEFFVKNGLDLGSRPSTNGVAWYGMHSYDYDNILCYGRLEV